MDHWYRSKRYGSTPSGSHWMLRNPGVQSNPRYFICCLQQLFEVFFTIIWYSYDWAERGKRTQENNFETAAREETTTAAFSECRESTKKPNDGTFFAHGSHCKRIAFAPVQSPSTFHSPSVPRPFVPAFFPFTFFLSPPLSVK